MLHAILASRVVLQLRDVASIPRSGSTPIGAVASLPFSSVQRCNRGHPGCTSLHGASSQVVVFIQQTTDTDECSSVESA